MSEQSVVTLRWRAAERAAGQPLWTTASQARSVRQCVQFELPKVVAGDLRVVLEQLRSYGQQWLDTYPEADAVSCEAYVSARVVPSEEIRTILRYFVERPKNGVVT